MYLIKKTKKPFGLVKVMLFGLFLVTYLGQAQITGIVFRDFNANGTKEANEPYVSGVTVTAYTPSGGACGSAVTTSPSSGTNYSLTGCSGSIRLQFSLPTLANGCSQSGIDAPTVRGSDVQFLNVSGAATANFPINYPGDYNTGTANAPFSAVNMTWGFAGAGNNFNGFPFVNTYSYNSNQNGATTYSSALNSTGTNYDFGTTWGLAYSKQADKLFIPI